MHTPEVLLLLKERSLEAAAEGVVISDCTQQGMPIIYINKAFTHITGYCSEEVIGKNCRFLQGPETDTHARQTIRKAISNETSCIVEILNYRKDNTPFWNRLSITPVKNEQGITTHFIGIQSDITRRREAEDALRIANQKLKDDLLAAAELQNSQLPTSLPNIEKYKFGWEFLPCQGLAGDTLNIITLDDSHIAIYILDVVGHGVRSALQSFSISHDIKPRKDGPDLFSPEKILHRLNIKYPMNSDTAMFFTIIYGVLDTNTGIFTYSSAGHPGPVLVKKDSPPQIIQNSSFPIGISPDTKYPPKTIHVGSGEKLILYTDGITEAVNHNNDALGEQQLLGLIEKDKQTDISDLFKSIIDSVKNWSKNSHILDDISLVGFQHES